MEDKKLFLIKNIWQCKWCRLEDNWNLSKLEKYFYTFKSIICILLSREFKNTQWKWYSVDYITTGMHSFSRHYNYEFGMDDASFTDITIGHGLFKNWYYFEMDNGWL